MLGSNPEFYACQETLLIELHTQNLVSSSPSPGGTRVYSTSLTNLLICYVPKDDLEQGSPSSCLHLLHVGITDGHHHTLPVCQFLC